MSSSDYDRYLQSEKRRYKKEFNQDIIREGYTDRETWDSLENCNEARICYLLKEPHDADPKISLTEYNDDCEKWLSEGKYGTFYNNFILFSKAIIDTINGKNVSKYHIDSLDLDEKRSIYRRISFINVKKSNGPSNSSNRKFNDFADDHLKKGLFALNPDILILGGTEESFDKMYPDLDLYYPKDDKQCLGDNPNDEGIWWFYFLKKGFDGNGEPKLIINFYHFSARVNSLLYMQALNKIVLFAIDYVNCHQEEFKNTRLFNVLCKKS
jgi:hypothetical protein